MPSGSCSGFHPSDLSSTRARTHQSGAHINQAHDGMSSWSPTGELAQSHPAVAVGHPGTWRVEHLVTHRRTQVAEKARCPIRQGRHDLVALRQALRMEGARATLAEAQLAVGTSARARRRAAAREHACVLPRRHPQVQPVLQPGAQVAWGLEHLAAMRVCAHRRSGFDGTRVRDAMAASMHAP